MNHSHNGHSQHLGFDDRNAPAILAAAALFLDSGPQCFWDTRFGSCASPEQRRHRALAFRCAVVHLRTVALKGWPELAEFVEKNEAQANELGMER